MDFGALLDRIQNKPQEEIIRKLKPDEIALVSSDEVDFPIQRSTAEQSETLKNMIREIEANRIIPLRNINSQTLKEIIALLKSLKNHSHLKDRALLDALENDVKILDPFALLAAVNYLDIPILLHLAARAIAQEDWTTVKGNKEFQEKLKKIFGNIQTILPLIAHYYFLLNNHILSDTDLKNYEFSVQDYIDYLPKKIRLLAKFSQDKQKKQIILDLERAQLRNLGGLENVPGIEEVEYLYLQNNQLTQIPDLSTLIPKLKHLNLSQNSIIEIPETLCKNNNLAYLNLAHNKIQSIPSCIATMQNLKTLYLEYNQIREIPDLAASSIRSLSLAYNQITTLPDSMSHMRELHNLFLNNNRINIDIRAFINYRKLVELNLSHNDFSNIVNQFQNGTLNAVTFSSLILQISHLDYLYLRGIPLKDATKKAIYVAVSPSLHIVLDAND